MLLYLQNVRGKREIRVRETSVIKTSEQKSKTGKMLFSGFRTNILRSNLEQLIPAERETSQEAFCALRQKAVDAAQCSAQVSQGPLLCEQNPPFPVVLSAQGLGQDLPWAAPASSDCPAASLHPCGNAALDENEIQQNQKTKPKHPTKPTTALFFLCSL